MPEITVCPLLVAWQQVMADLYAAGYSQHRIARALLTARSTVQRWHCGQEPKFHYGQALLVLHAQVLGQDRTRQRLQEAVYRDISERI